jgi:Cd2+/Zn2+-exporting ATPase
MRNIDEAIIKRFRRIGMIAGAAFFAVGIFFEYFPETAWTNIVTQNQFALRALFLAAWLLIGGEVAFRALRGIVKGSFFNENFLMTIATVGAFAVGEYAEGAAVMLFYQIGEALQDAAVNRSKRSISKLMDIRPDFANVMRNGEIIRVSPDEVRPGESIVVKPGEKIPLDGVVSGGCSALNCAALTGESLPRDAAPGDEVLSGTINLSALLTVTVSREFGESTVAKILNLIENAGSKKAPVENFITKFARWYTPAVVFAALALALIPPLFVPGAEFSMWLRRALVFLVVSCPCALVISIPLSFFGGIGGASKYGILFKGGACLSALNDVETMVFDKTGTLTTGVFSVSGIYCVPGIDREELLFYAAAAERNSNHPIAVSILRAYGGEIDVSRISSCEEKAGRGIEACIDGKTIIAGNDRFLEESGIQFQKPELTGTQVHIVINGAYSGSIAIGDEIKPDCEKTLAHLRVTGVKHIAMFTGDSRATARAIGAKLGLDQVYAEMLPHQKVEQLEILEHSKSKGKSKNGKIAFIGDGINDAPALARSDIGIAMGGAGSDAAIEAADIVLMTDEPYKLVHALAIAKKTKRIVWQNIILALGIKAVILALGALGYATMWEAVFGDVGVALIAVFNALRAAHPKTMSS